ncbi:MAG: hypothetical protein KDG44_10400, partial [Burkholderiaceae bacterium]|nr:hypothetical protein [Burkholderiaceae bacterium]
DAKWGEVVVAFIVAQPGAKVTADALDAHCLAHMARFKRPKQYKIVAALPKNNYGKVLKTALREQLAASGPQEQSATQADAHPNPAKPEST